MDSLVLSSGTTTPITSTAQSLKSSSRPSTPATEQDLLFSRPPSPTRTTPDEYVLVVGGLGYIGSHTTWELLKDGSSVVVIDNLSNAFVNVLDTLNDMTDQRFSLSRRRRPDLHFYEADFRDDAKIQEILTLYSSPSGSQIKRVIHFAAYKSVSESIEQPLKYYDNNVGGLIRFCNTLSTFNIKNLIFSSSATVGQNQTTLSGCTGLTNPYGRTKWICEAILSDLAVADPEWTITALRYFNPIGCDESGRLGEDPRVAPTNLMPVLLKVMLGEIDQLEVFGTDWDTRDGTAIRDFIHVSDLARGHLAALTGKDGQGFQTFNIGTGTGQTVYEVVEAMETASGRAIPVVKVGRRQGDVGACVADPGRAMTQLGWKPQKTLLDSCRDLCRFLEANGTRISL
ncbi:UDP-glucose 4-epimerase [Fusarium odoratissimum NRRL 54006]|uniref:UDP-glucose 4-epimerase n=1 Tax=Fusarium odoratissimum (strain NRRL 54006) TaxID=1089451 RepID=X0L3W5_FUSO5|nr:UDP-glucose 4-epimerase [Fusarium odoratissimum NRRL 54006]EXM03580.1 UDP-glucose 4-epimerase [Fusarium odoratissimum NRRL 54006]